MAIRGILAAIILTLIACSPDFESADEALADIVIDGSSTVYPIMAQAARLYTNVAPAVRIAVNFSGTTAGFRRFCQGETHVAAASRQIDADEMAICAANGIGFEELALGTDAIALVTHPRNQWLSSITLDELRLIWSAQSEGRINNWQQVNPAWPDQPLTLYGRGQDSGTYDYFTTEVTGDLRQSRSDYNASEDEDWLAAGIAADVNAFGFFGLGAYHRHWDTLRLVALDAGYGPVYPSRDAALSGSYQPLTRPLFVYVRSDALVADAADAHLTFNFLRHLYTNIANWMHFTGYLPLRAEQYADIVGQIEDRVQALAQ